jgi:hypothetical protein
MSRVEDIHELEEANMKEINPVSFPAVDKETKI